MGSIPPLLQQSLKHATLRVWHNGTRCQSEFVRFRHTYSLRKINENKTSFIYMDRKIDGVLILEDLVLALRRYRATHLLKRKRRKELSWWPNFRQLYLCARKDSHTVVVGGQGGIGKSVSEESISSAIGCDDGGSRRVDDWWELDKVKGTVLAREFWEREG